MILLTPSIYLHACEKYLFECIPAKHTKKIDSNVIFLSFIFQLQSKEKNIIYEPLAHLYCHV